MHSIKYHIIKQYAIPDIVKYLITKILPHNIYFRFHPLTYFGNLLDNIRTEILLF